jgi:hypothetical protein
MAECRHSGRPLQPVGASCRCWTSQVLCQELSACHSLCSAMRPLAKVASVMKCCAAVSLGIALLSLLFAPAISRIHWRRWRVPPVIGAEVSSMQPHVCSVGRCETLRLQLCAECCALSPPCHLSTCWDFCLRALCAHLSFRCWILWNFFLLSSS